MLTPLESNHFLSSEVSEWALASALEYLHTFRKEDLVKLVHETQGESALSRWSRREAVERAPVRLALAGFVERRVLLVFWTFLQRKFLRGFLGGEFQLDDLRLSFLELVGEGLVDLLEV